MHDAFDNLCPTKCGGTPAFPVGTALPSSNEAAAVGELRRPVPLVSTQFNEFVTSAVSGVTYAAGNASSFPNKMTPRADSMLRSLQTLFAQDNLFTSVSASIRVTLAYVVAPANIAAGDVTYFHEGRAVQMELVCPTQSDCAASGRVEAFARLAFAAGFDFIERETADEVYGSVLYDDCTAPVDLVFLIDASRSIEDPRNGGEPG